MSALINQIANRNAKVGIIGLGYVGIPLALCVSQAGFSVLGFDVSPKRNADLNAGLSPIKHIADSAIERMVGLGFEATDDFARAAECDVLIICVPTPLNKYREPDLGFVTATMEAIAPQLRSQQLLSLESTTWPGATVEVLLPFVERADLKPGKDFYLVYSPEREDPGNAHFQTRTIPKILGGHTQDCRQVGEAFYNAFIDHVVPVSSTQAAEMVKLLENIHRSVNIGLINEMKTITERMNLDIFEIVEAAKTKPFGFTAYYPGPGVGGHCIPIDPFYLTWKAREYGLHTRFIELAGEINARMPQHVVDRTIEALNAQGKSLQNAQVLALGIAYKKNVDDMRESPSVFVMELLRDWGAKVDYSDPHVPVFPEMREHQFDLESIDLSPETVASYDAVLMLTDHADFDYETIEKYAKLIIDTRGRFKPSSKKVWRA